MKAVVFRQYGDPQEVVELVHDHPIPTIKDNQVLIRVKAAAVNPMDWKIIKGYATAFVNVQFPAIVGYDVSGVIIKVGAEVQNYKEGDEVYTCPPFGGAGTFAEYFAVDASYIALKPKNLTHIEAAALPVIGQTTDTLLVETKKVTAGQKVLVLGGAGGTGSFAIQFLKHIGADIAATCSSRNVDYVKELGATTVLDYTKEDWGEVLKGQDFDYIYDTVGAAEHVVKAIGVLKSETGHFLSIVPPPPADPPVPYTCVATVASGKRMEAVTSLIESSNIKPIVSKVYKFEEAKDLIAESMGGRARGKLVLSFE